MDGVIVGVDTWNEEIFQSAPKLKCLARFGVGVDNIDLNAAKKYGVIVCNSPGIILLRWKNRQWHYFLA